MDASDTVRHAVYFALYPDAGAVDGARRLALEHGLKPVRQPHVSLVGLGGGEEAPPRPWIDRAARAAATVRQPPFLIELNTLSTFNAARDGRWPIVLSGEDGVIGVTLLAAALLAALAREGLAGRPPQTPHLTISWDSRQLPEQRIQPLRWLVREVLLIHSLQGAGRHRLLGRWPLAQQTADASDRPRGGD